MPFKMKNTFINFKSLILNKKIIFDEETGFTLVELIVVVVIIGILSSIAVPAFRNASDKSRQKEGEVLLSSYIKASKMFFIEHGYLATEAGHLDEYVEVFNCNANGPNIKNCRTNGGARTTGNSKEWHSPSGYFQIKLRYDNDRTKFTAEPTGSYSNQGYGVSACFNKISGNTKIKSSKIRGYTPPANC